jgi:2-oxoglutarate dehydrogenase E2 component (dihydrolipoamide succinyltransferase)
MAKVEVLMPKLGESVMEATITNWLVGVGDRVEAEQSLVEIATDKVDSEVPSPESGVLVELLFNEGDVVKIGLPFAIIETAGGTSEPVKTPSSGATIAEAKPVDAVDKGAAEVPFIPVLEETYSQADDNRFYSPLVKTIAKQENISSAELASIVGSGLDGRVTKNDIIKYINSGRKGAAAPVETSSRAPLTASVPSAPKSVAPPSPSPVTVGGGDTIVEMDRMRKLIAAHMVMSKQTSPHVTSYVEADVTNMVKWRERVKNDFQSKYGEKITFTPIIMEAVAQAIREFPGVNASVDGDRVILRGRVNLGMAAALPSGNLIVPVIKNADTMNLIGLTRAVNDLANRARQNKLSPDEIADGTYTITNVGTFGNVMGTPIINQPQVAILAVGAIRKMPRVLETAEGDVIAIRHMMYLSHSYDHRVVDGALGGKFVRRVADLLESFDLNRII